MAKEYMSRKNRLILNPIFIISLLVLAINDHLLKEMFHNWITGKISDFVGLIILPLFITFLVPRIEKWSCYISAVLFIYWKSELSSSLIEALNQNGFFTFGRVIDYSDLLALLVLPVSWKIIRSQNHHISNTSVVRLKVVTITSISFLLLTATSFYQPILKPEGTILIDKKYLLKVPKDTILHRIKDMGYNWEYVKEYSTGKNQNGYYQIENIIIPEIDKRDFLIKQDTIKKLTFYFTDFRYTPTKRQEKLGSQYLFIDEVTFSDSNHITSWKLMKMYSNLYKKNLDKLFVREATKKD